jgi:hypothetical protein
MCIMLTIVPGEEPQRGGLFIAARPHLNGPDPSGVTCRERACLTYLMDYFV